MAARETAVKLSIAKSMPRQYAIPRSKPLRSKKKEKKAKTKMIIARKGKGRRRKRLN